MRKSYKANNFLNVINKYAKKQKSKVLDEIREQELISQKKIENQILEDTKLIIKKAIIDLENEVAVEISHKELEERKKLSQRRKEIMKDVFKESRIKLQEFSCSDKYEIFLERSCKSVAQVINTPDLEILVKSQDIKYENLIKKIFNNCELKITDKIKLGGIIAQSKSKKIIVDDSLDSRLKSQRSWADENFGVLLVK
ncbi:MAG: hypothetical protein IJC57_03175 [Clostridia bacterium]|nr:hypothetical protein [Clostridia bacterium]